MDEYGREPCPHRIYADAGSAFAMGLIGGSIFHGIKGIRNAPVGFNNKMLNFAREIRIRSPVTGSQFAAWGGMFSVIDCCLVGIRNKEDPWNSIIAGATTGGLLCARMGKGPMIASAAFGGLILAVIEGAGLLMNRFTATWMNQPGMAPPEEPQVLDNKRPSGNVHSANFSDPATATSSFGMATHH